MKTIKCPKCNRANMEMYGVTEGGAYKYACPRCYHKIEEMKARILNPSLEPTDKKIPRIDQDELRRVYLYERAVEEEPTRLSDFLDKIQKLRNQRVLEVFDKIKRKIFK